MSNRNLKLPETGFMRLPAVLSVFPVGKSTWWSGIKSGKFPAPVKLSTQITAWRCEDIHELIQRFAKNGGA